MPVATPRTIRLADIIWLPGRIQLIGRHGWYQRDRIALDPHTILDGYLEEQCIDGITSWATCAANATRAGRDLAWFFAQHGMELIL